MEQKENVIENYIRQNKHWQSRRTTEQQYGYREYKKFPSVSVERNA